MTYDKNGHHNDQREGNDIEYIALAQKFELIRQSVSWNGVGNCKRHTLINSLERERGNESGNPQPGCNLAGEDTAYQRNQQGDNNGEPQRNPHLHIQLYA